MRRNATGGKGKIAFHLADGVLEERESDGGDSFNDDRDRTRTASATTTAKTKQREGS
ncbi:hypothetical protein [Haloarcula sp. H-GB5]